MGAIVYLPTLLGLSFQPAAGEPLPVASDANTLAVHLVDDGLDAPELTLDAKRLRLRDTRARYEGDGLYVRLGAALPFRTGAREVYQAASEAGVPLCVIAGCAPHHTTGWIADPTVLQREDFQWLEDGTLGPGAEQGRGWVSLSPLAERVRDLRERALEAQSEELAAVEVRFAGAIGLVTGPREVSLLPTGGDYGPAALTAFAQQAGGQATPRESPDAWEALRRELVAQWAVDNREGLARAFAAARVSAVGLLAPEEGWGRAGACDAAAVAMLLGKPGADCGPTLIEGTLEAVVSLVEASKPTQSWGAILIPPMGPVPEHPVAVDLLRRLIGQGCRVLVVGTGAPGDPPAVTDDALRELLRGRRDRPLGSADETVYDAPDVRDVRVTHEGAGNVVSWDPRILASSRVEWSRWGRFDRFEVERVAPTRAIVGSTTGTAITDPSGPDGATYRVTVRVK